MLIENAARFESVNGKVYYSIPRYVSVRVGRIRRVFIFVDSYELKSQGLELFCARQCDRNIFTQHKIKFSYALLSLCLFKMPRALLRK